MSTRICPVTLDRLAGRDRRRLLELGHFAELERLMRERGRQRPEPQPATTIPEESP